MIVQTVNESQFIDAFRTWDTYKDNFSYEGLKALYEELDQVSEYNDSKTIEFDVGYVDYVEKIARRNCYDWSHAFYTLVSDALP